jgi:hypothetical protein
MNTSLSDFRIVNPTKQGFSAAEARIGKTSIRFNNMTAAELGYPDFVRLLINQSGSALAIQPCTENDPCAVPFMNGRTAVDLTGQKKWTSIPNRMLAAIIREKMSWDNEKAPRRVYGSPWLEQGALLFDLTRTIGPRQRTSLMSADEMLRSYEQAERSFMPVQRMGFPQYCPVPPSEVIEAAFTQVG